MSNLPRDAQRKPAAANTIGSLDRPVPAGVNQAAFGSDVVADALRATEIPYLALNPGASYRGFHDSIVNYLGNTQPQMLLCLHEESAVHIAQGYAKVTGKAMAVAVHSNVGLMHATMAIFNAWCDRMPMLVLGATGPVDSAIRRPWIDWIHTAADQGALVRGYTKWDDQPASPAAAQESVLRAAWIANTAPCGPTYVNLDAGMQEMKLPAPVPPLDAKRVMPQTLSAPAPEAVKDAAQLLSSAKKLIILSGRVSRSEAAWKQRIELAERLGGRVITDLKMMASFPNYHALHIGVPGVVAPPPEALKAINEADVILSLDWLDLGGVFKHAGGTKAKVIQISLDHQLHNGWSMDYQALPPIDVFLACEPDVAVPEIMKALGPAKPHAVSKDKPFDFKPDGDKLTTDHLADALRRAVGDRPVTLAHTSLSWNGASWPFKHPLEFLGGDGGGGIGAGPGISVGAALALRDSDRLVIGVCGDGDFLMGVTAIWTAVHYKLPLLIVVANNRSFFNDELHQERVARIRNRPVENRWVGQRISEPDIDLSAMGRAQGAKGFGPVKAIKDLPGVFAEALAAVDAGQVAVVDVWVEPGYTAATTALMTRKGD